MGRTWSIGDFSDWFVLNCILLLLEAFGVCIRRIKYTFASTLIRYIRIWIGSNLILIHGGSIQIEECSDVTICSYLCYNENSPFMAMKKWESVPSGLNFHSISFRMYTCRKCFSSTFHWCWLEIYSMLIMSFVYFLNCVGHRMFWLSIDCS